MAVATLSRRNGRRQEAEAAARDRRSRRMLIGLSVVLVVVGVIEVPSMLSKLHGSSTATPAAPATPAAVAPGSAAATIGAAAVRAKLALIDRRFPVKDPFAAQLGQSSATVSAHQPLAAAPSVRTSRFVAKDPFKAQLAVTSAGTVSNAPTLAKAPPVTTPHQTATVTTKAPTSGYIVVLRSLGTKSSGLSELRRARASGFASAELLFSSKYTTLRRGYWVVYVRYPTAKGATAGTARAHGHGYPSAYRRIAKP